MFSLLNNTIRWYIIIGVLLYAILFAHYGGDCISWYNALNIYTFTSYALILWKSNKLAAENYTCRQLGVTIFVYSLLFVSLYLMMSEYYTGNTFIFSVGDARTYYNFGMEFLERPHSQWIPFLESKKWDFEDWGAPIAATIMLHIIPSKLFVNFCYITMTTLGGICLFKMGKAIMTTRYAYMASLSYAISSYSLFFMGSFLKEVLLVFFVIVSYYLLYMYMQNKRIQYMLWGGLISLVVIFFRPPIIIFIGMSYMTMLLINTKSSLFRFFVIFFIIIAAIAAIGIAQYSAERYANGGNVTESYEYVHYSTFKKIVLYFGALIGPFPYLLQVEEEISLKPLYGAGLLFKLFLFYAFWKGLWYAVKHKCRELMPIYIFVLLEVVGLSVALDGLELRKALPHVPLSIMASFWYLSVWDKKLENEKADSLSRIWAIRQFVITLCVVFGAVLVWNTMKT